MTPVLAHAGHWVVQMIYVAPLAVLGVAVALGAWRRRRAGRTSSKRRRSA
jgi:hypothetical protein